MENKVNKKALYLQLRRSFTETISLLIGVQMALGSDTPKEFINALHAVLDADYIIFSELNK